MKRLALILIPIIVFILCSPLTRTAQAGQSGQSNQQGQTAAPAQPAPTQAPGSGGAPANSSTTPPEPKPKKTWTNDDVGSLREDSVISTFNSPKPKPAKPNPSSAAPPGGKTANWYRAEIQKLQAQIPPLDDKIAKLHDAIDGKQVDEVRQYAWPKPDDWRSQLANLQKQREDILQKISALQDEARHKGIPPEQLP